MMREYNACRENMKLSNRPARRDNSVQRMCKLCIKKLTENISVSVDEPIYLEVRHKCRCGIARGFAGL